MTEAITLTPRQEELLWNLANGKTLGQASKHMLISYSTARQTVYDAKDRLGLNWSVTITHLVVVAMERGCIKPSEPDPALRYGNAGRVVEPYARGTGVTPVALRHAS